MKTVMMVKLMTIAIAICGAVISYAYGSSVVSMCGECTHTAKCYSQACWVHPDNPNLYYRVESNDQTYYVPSGDPGSLIFATLVQCAICYQYKPTDENNCGFPFGQCFFHTHIGTCSPGGGTT